MSAKFASIRISFYSFRTISSNRTSLFFFFAGGIVVSGGGDPFIFDRFVENGSGDPLTDFAEETSTTAFTDYLTSDDLFWSPSNAKLYVPTTFEPGSSISHFDDVTYDGTPNGLLTHALGFAEAIHNPGQLDVDVLSDIGWEAVIWTGIEDDLTIHRLDIYCWNHPDCPDSFWEMLGNNPATVLNVGDSPYYSWWFIDEEPYNGTPNLSWKFEALHSGGRYLLEECTSSACNPDGAPNTWNFTVPDLPSGYNWSRNFNNQVRALLTVSGSDQYGYSYKEELEISINYKPNAVDVEFLNNSKKKL